MAPRDFARSFAGGALWSGMARLNARHPWSHNDHFHRWILANLPARRRTALDVGCGQGGLVAALAPHFGVVIGNDVDAALRDVRDLLAPGGRFLVVGLAPPRSVTDHLWDVASIVTNPLIGLAKHPRVSRTGSQPPAYPVQDPTMAYDDLRRLVESELPGARMRHRLGFRHTIAWTKPT